MTSHANCNSEIIIGSGQDWRLEKIPLTPIDDHFERERWLPLNFTYDRRFTASFRFQVKVVCQIEAAAITSMNSILSLDRIAM